MTAGISLDKNAWDFFAELFKAIIKKMTLKEKEILAKENVTRIKINDEEEGISRNRFTSTYQIITTTSVRTDIFGMFGYMLNGESALKKKLAIDFTFLYHSDHSKISKENRKQHKSLIEKVADNTDDMELKNKLQELLQKI